MRHNGGGAFDLDNEERGEGRGALRAERKRITREERERERWAFNFESIQVPALSTQIQKIAPLVPGGAGSSRAAGEIEPPWCRVVRAAGEIARSFLGYGPLILISLYSITTRGRMLI